MINVNINNSVPEYDSQELYDAICEEFADIYEVLDTMIELYQIKSSDLEGIYCKKNDEKGRMNRTFLVEVIDN